MSSTAPIYPPVSFCFTVSIAGASTGNDTSFQEVSGLSSEFTTFELKEGGENRFSYQLPERVKYGNLILKRGIMLMNSPLAVWFESTLSAGLNETITPQQITVSLLNADQQPLLTWNFVNAWPVKWSVVDLNAEKNEVAIETMELAYSYFTRLVGSGNST